MAWFRRDNSLMRLPDHRRAQLLAEAVIVQINALVALQSGDFQNYVMASWRAGLLSSFAGQVGVPTREHMHPAWVQLLTDEPSCAGACFGICVEGQP